MSRRIAVVGAWSIVLVISASGCGARAADIEIAGPTLRADPLPRPLSYESKLSDGLLATLSSTEARAAAQYLHAHPSDQLGCANEAAMAASCGVNDCSQSIDVFDECLALASLRESEEDGMVRTALGMVALSAGECALLAKASRGPASLFIELFDGLSNGRKGECDQIAANASLAEECSADQVAELNRCLTELVRGHGRQEALATMTKLVEAYTAVSPTQEPPAGVLSRLSGLLKSAIRTGGHEGLSARSPTVWVLASPGSRLSEPAISFPSVSAAAVALPSSLESQIINGLADFLVARAREEGLDYLAETVGQRLCERQVEGVHIKTFFSETCRLLRGRDGLANVGLALFGSTLQRALERDLRGLLPVMLNHAIGKLDGKWGHLDVFLQLVVQQATGSSPPRLDELLRIGEQNIECDGENGLACALRLVCITAVAVHESRAEDACSDGARSATCVAVAAARVTDALARDAKLEAWLDYGIRADGAQRQRLVRRLMDQLVELEQVAKSGEPSIAQLVALLRTGVEVVMPAGHRERAYLVLGQLENHVNRWGELGYVVYHVTDAILGGREPARGLIAAAETASCTSLTDDLGCGIRASGYIASALLSLRAKWPKPGSAQPQVADFLRAVEKRLALVLGHPDNTNLRAWLRNRFAIGATPGRLTDRTRLTDVIEQLLGELRSLEVATETAGKPDTDRLVAAADVLNASARLFRTVVSLTIQSEAIRARALRVIDGVADASAAVSRRELAPFMTALYALAVDLGVPDPVPERVRRYVPFVTALTTAETSEQVSAAFQRYAAPVGGYRIKQQEGKHYSLSALVGVAGGVERGIASRIDLGGQFSVFAPVGFDVTFGAKRLPGWGFMASLFDLGALTAVRVDDSKDAASDADVSFKQVFSPGLHLRVPMMGPTVLGAGLSMVPGLRRPDDTGQAEAVFRALLFVAIDVTLFEL